MCELYWVMPLNRWSLLQPYLNPLWASTLCSEELCETLTWPVSITLTVTVDWQLFKEHVHLYGPCYLPIGWVFGWARLSGVHLILQTTMCLSVFHRGQWGRGSLKGDWQVNPATRFPAKRRKMHVYTEKEVYKYNRLIFGLVHEFEPSGLFILLLKQRLSVLCL